MRGFMKKIPVWAVVLLVIVTIGIYAIFWAARNRDYLQEHNKKVGKLPKWGWLIAIPSALVLFVGAVIVLMILAIFGALAVDTAVNLINVLTIAYIAFAIILGAWWVWHFGKAMEIATHGRITRNWSVFLYIFIGPMLIAFYQFFINTASTERAKIQREPSSVFMFIAMGVVAISIISTVISLPGNIESTQTLRSELERARQSMISVDEAFKAYTLCTNGLQAKLPGNGTGVEVSADYQREQDKCNALYAEYEKALDAIKR